MCTAFVKADMPPKIIPPAYQLLSQQPGKLQLQTVICTSKGSHYD
ncbi:MAG: hypothetical protein RMK18_11860 [Armatimonadota bacterium]|nr:hypothetical protein [Armatimonadota bacterium]MCX7778384.1 hypothetical protein [Armatimonadota bacterium]MDW8026542.1 hypothetical protein [Armatimonadota bacterium]